jgi:hypothetical protein
VPAPEDGESGFEKFGRALSRALYFIDLMSPPPWGKLGSWSQTAQYDKSAIDGLEPVWPEPPQLRNPKTVLYNEPGGSLDEHLKRWRALAQSNDDVEIRGRCPSACTMILAYVPHNRLCFGEAASLQFHMTRNAETGEPSISITQWMINQYPQDIRKWIISKGGVAKMTILQMWTLEAEELWQMGYQRCGPEARPVPPVIDTRSGIREIACPSGQVTEPCR